MEWANGWRSLSLYVNRSPGGRRIKGTIFRSAHGFKHGNLDRVRRDETSLETRWRRRQVRRQNSVNWGSLLRRAGATGGGREGRPRQPRILQAMAGSSMAARIRIRPRQRGHSRTSSAHARHQLSPGVIAPTQTFFFMGVSMCA